MDASHGLLSEFRKSGNIDALLSPVFKDAGKEHRRRFSKYELRGYCDGFRCYQYAGYVILDRFYPGVFAYIEQEYTTSIDADYFVYIINHMLSEAFKRGMTYKDLMERIAGISVGKITRERVPALASSIEAVVEDGFLLADGTFHGELYIPRERGGRKIIIRVAQTVRDKEYWEFGHVEEWLEEGRKTDAGGIPANYDIIRAALNSFWDDRDYLVSDTVIWREQFESMLRQIDLKDAVLVAKDRCEK